MPFRASILADLLSMRWITGPVLLLLTVLGAMAGYRYAESQLAVTVYRDRLRSVSEDYEHLRREYNEAVRRTAVTELRVEKGQLSVVIRTADGRARIVPTPFDPAGEIYVDYVVRGGRLWVRRVFDAHTPPRDAVVIDPLVDAAVDWNQPDHVHGKAVYRSLEEGRWVVTVTGDGSLGLSPADADRPTPLVAAPPVRDYPQIESEIRTTLEHVSFTDMLRAALGGSEAGTSTDK